MAETERLNRGWKCSFAVWLRVKGLTTCACLSLFVCVCSNVSVSVRSNDDDDENRRKLPLCEISLSIFAFFGPVSYFSFSLLSTPSLLSLIPPRPWCNLFMYSSLPSPSFSLSPYPLSTCPNHCYTSLGHLISADHLVGALENVNQFAQFLEGKSLYHDER